MDFTKFVAMLEHGGLFFCRADKLGDPFEGSIPRANEKLRARLYEEAGISDDVFEQMADFWPWLRKWTMVCCWHMNHHESAAMWRLYARTDEALAVRTTFARLRECLDESAYVGVVKYIDYQNEWLPEDNRFWPYVYKRASFAHEQEVRAVIQKMPAHCKGGIDRAAPPPRDGVWKPTDLSALIDAVFVAPTSPEWFWELTQKVTTRHIPALRVIRSALDEEPFY